MEQYKIIYKGILATIPDMGLMRPLFLCLTNNNQPGNAKIGGGDYLFFVRAVVAERSRSMRPIINMQLVASF
jgi:hypothetical protein